MLGRCRHRCVKNTKIVLTEHECMDLIDLAQDKVQLFSRILLET
jgi:hypothetical protein